MLFLICILNGYFMLQTEQGASTPEKNSLYKIDTMVDTQVNNSIAMDDGNKTPPLVIIPVRVATPTDTTDVQQHLLYLAVITITTCLFIFAFTLYVLIVH